MRCLTLILLLSLAACRPGSESEDVTGVLRDDLGRTVELTAEQSLVFPLAPNLTEIVVELGARDRLVAISPADDFPPGIDHIPRLSTLPLDLERTIALRPDLLLANAAVNRTDEPDRLKEFGISTYFFTFTSVSDVPRAMRTTGELLGLSDTAEEVATRFEERMEAVRDASEDLPRRRVLLLIGDQTLYAFGAASYTQELIAIAGGESITTAFRGEGVTLSREFVLQSQPDVIVGAFGEDYNPARLIELHPSFREVEAVKQGRVYSMDPDLLKRPGPRLADGAERLFELIHGERATGR